MFSVLQHQPLYHKPIAAWVLLIAEPAAAMSRTAADFSR
jgi:hypothetical protein